MNQTIIQAHDLTKIFGKTKVAVKELNLAVNQGEVFGYLGPNGAGKSTTIRMMLDFIRPTKGGVSLFGLDAHQGSQQIRQRTGYLSGDLPLYDNLTGRELLEYLAELRGGVDWAFIRELAERLDSNLSQQIRELSRGNKQKIGLIQAFMRRPDLLILDEPTSGLDPLKQQEFNRMLDEVKADGRTVFLSSHTLPEVERVCDRVGIIREGELAAVEHINTLKERALRRLEIHFGEPVAADDFQNLEGAQDMTVQDSVLRCSIRGSLDAVIKAAARYEVINVISHEPSLEEIFLTYYGNREASSANAA